MRTPFILSRTATSPRGAFTEIQETFMETFTEVVLIFTAISHRAAIVRYITRCKEAKDGETQHIAMRLSRSSWDGEWGIPTPARRGRTGRLMEAKWKETRTDLRDP